MTSRQVIETRSDEGQVLELRPSFGCTMITALMRVEGRAVGVIANIRQCWAVRLIATGPIKLRGFMQVCDAFDVPILHLCDTPGIMVGPEVEKTALVRHAARMLCCRV